MDSGLYSAYSGLRVNADILDVLSNNLANVNTTGFKSDQAFLRIYNHAVSDSSISMDRVLNDSSFVEGSAVNFFAGPIKQTGRDLDVALEGRGFFVVQGPTGSFFTRNGSFQVSGAGSSILMVSRCSAGTGPFSCPRAKSPFPKMARFRLAVRWSIRFRSSILPTEVRWRKSAIRCSACEMDRTHSLRARTRLWSRAAWSNRM